MEETEIQAAAEFLARSRIGGPPTPSPPPHLTPENEREGYAIQDALHSVLAGAGGGRLSGHKIGCTTAVMQEFLSIDHPCAGCVFETTVFKGAVELPLSRFHRIGVECEIAARLGADMLGARGPYTRESVTDAVTACMGAIELVDDRYENYSALAAPVLIADDFFNAGVVLGDENQQWRALDLANVCGVLKIDGTERASGLGSDILGHPMEALAWLANHRAGIGRPLRSGDFVLLGSVVQTVFFDAPAHVAIELEGLSCAEVRFT
ncbi:MAG: sulfate adenylyltransferase [Rhodospirillaceae bacterium]|nr:sulfate adenylyltransferase [Rhodospirillaceae bacterium]